MTKRLRQRIIGLTVMAALLCIPYLHAQLAPKPVKPAYTLIEACIATAVIGLMLVVYIGASCYNHVGNGTSSPPLFTNDPPGPIGPPPPSGTNDYPPWTNPPVAVNLSGGPIPVYDISAMGFADTWGNDAISRVILFTNSTIVTLLTGDDPNRLEPTFILQAWFSKAGRLLEFRDTNGVPVATNYARWGETNRAYLNLVKPGDQKKFFAIRP